MSWWQHSSTQSGGSSWGSPLQLASVSACVIEGKALLAMSPISTVACQSQPLICCENSILLEIKPECLQRLDTARFLRDLIEITYGLFKARAVQELAGHLTYLDQKVA